MTSKVARWNQRSALLKAQRELKPRYSMAILVTLVGAAHLLVLSSLPVWAQDWVAVPERLSDEDFHRAVACGATPGGLCREPERRWPPHLACDLTVSIRHVAEGYPGWLYDVVSTALDSAIVEIKNVEAGIALRRLTDTSDADIKLYLPLANVGEVVQQTGETPPDGETVDSAFFLLSDDGQGWLTGSKIVLPRDLFEFKVRSVVLEELTQSLGLPYDVWGKPYAFASIFDDNSDALDELSAQDKSALRMHYPSSDPCAIAGMQVDAENQDPPT